MASALPAALDHLISLLEGTATGISRVIPAGRFKHVAWEIESLLSGAVSAPYPFTIVDEGETMPSDVPATLSGSQIWHGCNWLIRVAYCAAPLNRAARAKTVMEDRYQIRRTVGYTPSWLAVPQIARAVVEEGAVSDLRVLGAAGDEEIGALHVLEIPLVLTYRESHT